MGVKFGGKLRGGKKGGYFGGKIGGKLWGKTGGKPQTVTCPTAVQYYTALLCIVVCVDTYADI